MMTIVRLFERSLRWRQGPPISIRRVLMDYRPYFLIIVALLYSFSILPATEGAEASLLACLELVVLGGHYHHPPIQKIQNIPARSAVLTACRSKIKVRRSI
jgi:hypothetical protein